MTKLQSMFMSLFVDVIKEIVRDVLREEQMKSNYIDLATNLIIKWEGFRDKAYLPTPNDVPTIGYGFTKGVKMGDTMSLEQAKERLQQEIKEFDTQLSRVVTVPLNDSERAAVLSLVFNIGIGAFQRSNALKALNAGNKEKFVLEAFDSVVGFVRQGGQVLRGLVNRRADEKRLFLSL